MLPVTLSPSTAYATKGNIKFPGVQAAATAAEAACDARIEDTLDGFLGITGLDWAIAGGSIKLAA